MTSSAETLRAAALTACKETLSRLATEVFFETHSLVQHQLDSFDYFLNVQLPQMMYGLGDLRVRNFEHKIIHSYKFVNCVIERPVLSDGNILLPQEAKLRNLTYEGAVYVDIEHKIYENCKINPPKKKGAISFSAMNPEEGFNEMEYQDLAQEDETLGTCVYTEQHNRVLICRLPIMVKSSRCHLSDLNTFYSNSSRPDFTMPTNSSFCEATRSSATTKSSETQPPSQASLPQAATTTSTADGLKKEMCNELYPGGYFIIKGQEKTVLIQERMRYMHPCITVAPKIQSCQKYLLVSEFRSCNEQKVKASSTLKMFLSKPNKEIGYGIYMQVPFLKSDKGGNKLQLLPLTWCFRLLGVTSAEEMENYIIGSIPMAKITKPVFNASGSFEKNGNSGSFPTDRREKQYVLPEHDKRFRAMVSEICRQDLGTAVPAAAPALAAVVPVHAAASAASEPALAAPAASVQKKTTKAGHWISLTEIIQELSTQILYLMKHEVLPHVGVDESALTIEKKRRCLAEIARRLILTQLKYIPVDCREHLIHKRFETSGLLIALMFRQLLVVEIKHLNLQMYKMLDKFEKARKKMGASLDALAVSATVLAAELAGTASSSNDNTKSVNGIAHEKVKFNVRDMFHRPGIAEGLRYALATGNWGKNKGASNSQQGVSQPLNRTSPMTTYSHLRRTQVPINRDGKSSEPRQLQTSHYGILCPNETPEGKSCGLLKQLSLFAHVNTGLSRRELCGLLESIRGPLRLFDIAGGSMAAAAASGGGCNASGGRASTASGGSAGASTLKKNKFVHVFVNGSPEYEFEPTSNFGIQQFLNSCREFRRLGVLPWYVSIYSHAYFETCNIHITCHVGNFVRPVFNSQKLLQVYNKLKASSATTLPESVLPNATMPAQTTPGSPPASSSSENDIFFQAAKKLLDSNIRGRGRGKTGSSKRASLASSETFFLSNEECHVLWRELISSGMIVYVDKNEENDLKVAHDWEMMMGGNASGNTSGNASGTGITGSDKTTMQCKKVQVPYDHMELAPWSLFGVMSALIPLVGHDQAVRAIFQCSHGKAAVGISNWGFQKSVHAIHHMLWYPQAPLVDTDADRILKTTTLPTGQNAIVAINVSDGFNPEDAIILCRSSIDFGLFRSQLFNTYPYEDSKNDCLRFGKLDDTLLSSPPNGAEDENKTHASSGANESRNLDMDGLPQVGVGIKYGDNLLQQIDYSTVSSDADANTNANSAGGQDSSVVRIKPVPYKGKGANIHLAQAYGVKQVFANAKEEAAARRKVLAKHSVINGSSNNNSSGIIFDTNEPASRVERVFLTNSDAISSRPATSATAKNSGDQMDCENDIESSIPRPRTTMVSLSVTRIPIVGDKFSSRHGQKGVCARVVNREDMPWTAGGMHPDMIINPHAMPSRMTVAQLIENVLGKAGLIEGCHANGTSFRKDVKTDLANAEDVLFQHGFSKCGKERMYSGHTGRMIEALIFMGPVNYQRLTHQATEKLHARPKGPMEAVTGQPTSRRSKNGAPRNGEMERDQLIAHGSTLVVKDRLMNESDRTPVQVCRDCGILVSSFSLENEYDYKEGRLLHYQTQTRDPQWTIAERAELYGINISGLVCKNCGKSGKNIAHVTLPKAYCALVQEMMSMGIYTKLILD